MSARALAYPRLCMVKINSNFAERFVQRAFNHPLAYFKLKSPEPSKGLLMSENLYEYCGDNHSSSSYILSFLVKATFTIRRLFCST